MAEGNVLKGDLQLARVLSGNLLPMIPEGVTPEEEHYIRALHEYLRRFAMTFNVNNIRAEVEAALPEVPDKDETYYLIYNETTKTLGWEIKP